MIVYRISDCRYIKDLSGKGAALYGGRWNNRDTYMVYTAQNRGLALLEAVVHMGIIPPNGYCMVSIELPDNGVFYYPPEHLPPDWYQSPAPDYLRLIGDNFIQSGKYLAMAVPSVLMMEEYNILLNPRHADFGKVKIKSERPLQMDERLVQHAVKPKKST